MAQDEYFVSSSNSAGSCGGGDGGSAVTSCHNRSKIAKQKKAPQRGLGVAQLERLRLEEQRNRAPGPANALPNNAIGPAHSPVSAPASPPASSNLAPPPPLFRSVVGPSAPNDETGLRGVSSWPRLWGGEYNDHHNYLEGGGEKQRVDHHHHHHHHNVEFAFGPQINLTMQHETNSPVSPFPGGGGPQWSFQFQRPPSSSVTNVSSGISPSSSQMEPPSIQSVRGNNYSPSWSEDDKIAVGMKRAYPFNIESPAPPTPSFFANFHASGSRSEEFPSSSNEPRNKYIRDGRLSSTPGPKQIPAEETRLFGDLLTLAPPVAAPPATPLRSKNKHPLDYFGDQGLDLSDNRSLSSQETMRSSQTHQAGPSTSTEQPFSFFPIKPQTEKTSTHARNGNGEKGEILDLNLKL